MARRQLLTDEQWARLLAPPSDEREIFRYWTLSREDFDIIFRKRSDHSRLGFALPFCYLRYPGRVLGAEEVPRYRWFHSLRRSLVSAQQRSSGTAGGIQQA
jgi:TnpA family transposase